jgi:undecaprenyl pyrophosphate phosphatase UppP
MDFMHSDTHFARVHWRLISVRILKACIASSHTILVLFRFIANFRIAFFVMFRSEMYV